MKSVPYLVLLLLGLNTQPVSAQLDPELEQTFQVLLDADRSEHQYAGISAAVNYPGGCTWSGVSGTSLTGEAIDTTTVFQIGLTSPIFMATLVFMLQEEGQLSINDSIGQYLPQMEHVGSTITIRQLLNWTSGLGVVLEFPSVFDTLLYGNPDRFWHPDTFVTRFLKPPLGAPGDLWFGSLANDIFLARIIETVTGKEYHTVLRERILTPLGLEHTFLPPYEAFDNDMPAGRDPGVFPGNIIDTFPTAMASALWAGGALVSTPADVLTFLKELLDGHLISDASLEMMTDTIHIQGMFGEWQGRGLGIGFLTYQDIPFYGQTGFVLQRTRAWYSPEKQIGVTTFQADLANTDAFYDFINVINSSLDACQTTPAEDIDKVEVSMFPNPTSDWMIIELPDSQGPVALSLYNAWGQLSKHVDGIVHNQLIEVADLPEGQYVCALAFPDGSSLRKMLIIH